jgi:hypothetical protein
MEKIQEANKFLDRRLSHMSTSDRVKASREAKSLVLGLNEIYKRTKDPKLMDIMKAITVKKQKIEKRIKGPIII